ncbi:insulin activator factor [uncultured Streptococcus sp.]|uniref:insulin activator factor n=1 Tax=uncultured Streptococcus sp. TaxID=83427 RepID=UPI0028D3D707|nr:insulin activator factor [uncultured Streptococcus sp.]
MKSNKLILVNGIAGILGGLIILYASSNRWHWEIVALVSKLVENSGWGGLIVLISLLFLVFSIAGIFHYSHELRVNKTSHELLFCASIMGFISFLSIFSCLLAIISGIFYLQDVPRFKSDDKAD